MNHPITHTPFVSQSVFWKSILIVAGLLLGMGVVFAVASNWQNLSRTDKFTILQSTIVASAALTLFVRSARVAGALLLILCIGAVWADVSNGGRQLAVVCVVVGAGLGGCFGRAS